MTERRYVTFSDDAIRTLLTKAEAALTASEHARVAAQHASRRFAEAVQRDDRLARTPANSCMGDVEAHEDTRNLHAEYLQARKA